MERNASTSSIEIRVDRAAQLLHTLDPVPFRERDLDQEAEDFIVSWARELPPGHKLKIVVHLPATELDGELAKGLGDVLSRYFLHRADSVRGELRELFRNGRWSLLVGLCVLAACITSARLLPSDQAGNEIAPFIREGLLILGWVANWRPIEIFLYEWWPLLRKRNLYRRLAAAETMLKPC